MAERMLRGGGLACLAVLSLAVAASSAGAQQLTQDQQAAQLLDAGRRAYNERNFPFAAERFREFLRQFAAHKDANQARFGLGLALLDTPIPEYPAAIEALRAPADQADFPQRALAQYHLGAAQRALGNAALTLAAQRPNEAPQHRQAAAQQFDPALKMFDAAAQSFAALAAKTPAAEKISAEREWELRARADQAEMLLKLNRPKEALALVEPLLKAADIAQSQYQDLLKYYAGYALYVQGDAVSAARLLSQLAPFTDPAYGPHARYMLGRTHHLAGEGPEAAALYSALVSDHEAQVQSAVEQLKNPQNIKDPAELARLEALAKSPAPDFVARAAFFASVLLYEQERFAEALERLTKFPAAYPTSPLVAESQLRKGFCQVRMKRNAEAIQTLNPLADHPALGDQARWWMGRAHVALADPTNAGVFQQNISAAISQLGQAAARAGQLAAQDPAAKLRRHDELLELADAQQLAKQYRESANTLGQVLAEQPDVERAQQAAQRQAVGLHLAAAYKESDDACVKFQQTWPQSPLLASVLFRYAENALAAAETANANANLPNRPEALKQLYGEAIKRYEAFLQRYPEFAYANTARQGLGMSHYRLADYEKAAETLKQIADADRTGDLGNVSYMMADCLMRTAPSSADDALSAGLLLEQLGEAAKLLDAFTSGQPQNPLVNEALVKLGDCHQRMAAVIAEGQERNLAVQSARTAYEKVMQQPNSPMFATAVFERAKSFTLLKDYGTATNELNRFLADPLKNTAVAPMAVLRLATLLRSQNKPQDAANALAATRAQHEGPILADASRAAWAPLLQYHHALALKEAGKLPEAQQMFENLVQRFANSGEAPFASWRAGQCRKDQIVAKLTAAQAVLANSAAKPEEKTAAQPVIADALKQISETSTYFEQQAAAVGQKLPGSEPHLRLFYEAAWCQRLLSEFEVAAARAALQAEAQKKLDAEIAQKTPAGQPAPKLNAALVTLSAVPVQPAEQKARQLYAALVSAGPEAPLALVCDLELAELHANRGEHDIAIQRLKDALAKDVPEELAERMQVRLGDCYLAKQDGKSAVEVLQGITQSATSKVSPEARYRQAEAQLLLGDAAAAIALLTPFRDKPELQQIPELSDRAMLRLGHAYAQAGQWDPSRQAFEIQTQRYPQSRWRLDAIYGSAWAWQNQNQFDQAVNTYQQITRAAETAVAARAQLQIGLCRLAQKRYPEAATALLVAPFTYDYPEESALALTEAARAMTEMKQPVEAANLLRRVVKDHPDTKWAEVAKERLEKLAM